MVREQYRTLVSLAPHGVVLADERGRIVEFNDLAATQFGYSRGEFAELRLNELLNSEGTPDAHSPAAAWMQRYLAADGREVEARHRSRSGEVNRVLVSVRPLHGEGKGHFLFVVQDIEARKRTEEALRASEARLSQAVSLAGLGIWDWEPATDRTVWNDEMLRIYGITREDFTGRGQDYIAATRTDYAEPQRSNIRQAFEGGLSREQLERGDFRKPPVRELCIVRPDGTERYTLGSAVTQVDAEGRPVRMLGVTRDVTDERKAEQERVRLEAGMSQASKLESIGQLAGGVAHDFNNLLTVILSCADALEQNLTEGTPVSREDVQDIRHAGERARDLTRQLLTFARKQMVKPVPLDMNVVVRGSEKMLHRVLGEDIELDVRLDPELWPIRCDLGQLEQIVMNLSVNARDAMRAGGRLTIQTLNGPGEHHHEAASQAEGWVRLVVRDTGAGLSPEAKDHLFEPFFTTKEKGKGTGLGLATVYGIVKQSGGHIHVVSAEGKGTTFEICLPRSYTVGGAALENAGAPTARGSEVVLVVEDDPHVRGVTVRSLRAAGYEVIIASNGVEALSLGVTALGRVRLLVTDVVMPAMGGAEVARELCRRSPALKVLFVSGHPEETISNRGELAAGVELLLKPFTSTTLLARVRAVLDA